jgi:hypothetical protein
MGHPARTAEIAVMGEIAVIGNYVIPKEQRSRSLTGAL